MLDTADITKEYRRALGLAASKEWLNAAEGYRGVLRQDPTHAEARCGLAEALQNLGRAEEAVAECREALNLDPKCSRVVYELGRILATTYGYKAGLEYFTRAVELQPDNARYRCGLGATLTGMGNPTQGAVQCREAIRLDPQFGFAYYSLSLAHARLNEFTEALKVAILATKLEPGNAMFEAQCGWMMLGCSVGGLRMLQVVARRASARTRRLLNEAKERFDRALLLNPREERAWEGLSLVQWQMGDRQKALACIQQEIAFHPEFWHAHSQIVLMQLWMGHLLQAFQSFKRACRCPRKTT